MLTALATRYCAMFAAKARLRALVDESLYDDQMFAYAGNLGALKEIISERHPDLCFGLVPLWSPDVVPGPNGGKVGQPGDRCVVTVSGVSFVLPMEGALVAQSATHFALRHEATISVFDSLTGDKRAAYTALHLAFLGDELVIVRERRCLGNIRLYLESYGQFKQHSRFSVELDADLLVLGVRTTPTNVVVCALMQGKVRILVFSSELRILRDYAVVFEDELIGFDVAEDGQLLWHIENAEGEAIVRNDAPRGGVVVCSEQRYKLWRGAIFVHAPTLANPYQFIKTQ